MRAFARRHFAIERELAAIVVLHAPHIAPSGNDPHFHVLVQARKLGINGFGETARRLCSDKGQEECWNAWQPLLQRWDAS